LDKELKIYLERFRECSLNIIDIVEKEAYEELEGKIEERQRIIDSINELNYSDEDTSQFFQDIELITLSEKINNIINNKKAMLKAQIEENAAKKNASNNYNKSFNNNFHVFSKKV